MTKPIVRNPATGQVTHCTACDAQTIHATLFAEAYPYDAWFHSLLSTGDEQSGTKLWFGDHFGLNRQFVDKWHGRVFTMVRSPSRLRVSQYQRQQEYDLRARGLADYPPTYRMTSATKRPHPEYASLVEYAQRMEADTLSYMSVGMRYDDHEHDGAYAKLRRCFNYTYAREAPSCSWSSVLSPSRMDRALADAKTSVVNGRYAYIGLTDEWSTSICLFHAMYGAFGARTIRTVPALARTVELCTLCALFSHCGVCTLSHCV